MARGFACLEAIADAQFLVEMFDVMLHRVDRDNQFARDLLVAPSCSEQAQHAFFLDGERRNLRAICVSSSNPSALASLQPGQFKLGICDNLFITQLASTEERLVKIPLRKREFALDQIHFP